MNNVLINACGIKSLGGINVLKSSIENINQHSNVSLLVSDEKIQNELSLSNKIDTIVTVHKPRYMHPFLSLFLSKDLRNWINSFDITIHFANFGFKTKTKDILFVQNILPHSNIEKNARNYILRFFINRSLSFASIVVVQNEHVIKYLPGKFRTKIKNIGVLSESSVKASKHQGIIAISNDLKYKNVDLIEKVMKKVREKMDCDLNITLITDKKENITNTEISYISNLSPKEIDSELKRHSIFFHASAVETLCLPILEAQSKGLVVVAPNLDYANNAVQNKDYLYEYINIEDATEKIFEAISDSDLLKSVSIKVYRENWGSILK